MCFSTTFNQYETALKKLLAKGKTTFVGWKAVHKDMTPLYMSTAPKYQFGHNYKSDATQKHMKVYENIAQNPDMVDVQKGIHVFLTRKLALKEREYFSERSLKIIKVICRVADLIGVNETEAVLTQVFVPKQ